MSRYEFEGRSAAEAAIKACEQLGLIRSELRYQVLSESGEGIERRVVIAVDHDPTARVAAPAVAGIGASTLPRDRDRDRARDEGRRGRDRREARGPGRFEREEGRGRRRRGEWDRDRDRDRGRPRRPLVPQEADDGFEALLKLDATHEAAHLRPALTGEPSAKGAQARTVLNDLLRLMHFEANGFVVQDDTQEIHLDVRGRDASRIIGKKGEPLLSLQFLVNRMVSHDTEGEPVVVLDVAGYRERRRLALAELAKKLAQRAVEEHKVVKLSPMSAHDRRVFHLTLTEVSGVMTQSEGDGLFRHLLIIPSEFADGGAR